jgi:hypothetical protein
VVTAGIQPGVIGLGAGEIDLGGVDHVGVGGGDLLALLGRAGLHQDRPALRRRRRVERAAHREVLAAVIEHVELGRVVELARRLVVDEGVRFPAVPQAGDDVDELLRPIVARVVVEVRVAAEVPGLLLRP